MVMDVFKRLLNRVKLFRKSGTSDGRELTPEVSTENCLKPYQRYVFKIQNVIVWDQPSESVLALVLVNVFFWVLTRLEWRFFGLFFSAALAYVVHEAWTVHVWPEICIKRDKFTDTEVTCNKTPGGLSVPELSKYAGCVRAAVSEQLARLRALRSNQPGLFCFIVCGVSLLLAGLGGTISGLGLLYVITMSVMLIPGGFIHLVPPERKQQMFTCLHKVSSVIKPSEGSVDVEEYLPESSKENMELFALAGEVQSESNAPSSSSSDECLMASVMPSHEDSSMDALDSLSLDPSVTPVVKQEGSSDSDSEVEAIRFKNTHFNGDDSSADEDVKHIAKDLSFPDIAETSYQGPGLSDVITDTIAKNLSKLSGNLQLFGLGSLVKLAEPTRPPPPQQNDDSDSDFEIIKADDIS